MKALLIEDNPIFQIKLRNILHSLSWKVVTTSSLKEATQLLKVATFDLLVCDIVLEDGEFFDIEAIPYVPTIFITAYENPLYMKRALSINDASFIVKPFSDLTFIALVERATNKFTSAKSVITVFGKHKNPIDLKVEEVEVIESEGNYTCVSTIYGEKYIVKRSAKKIIENVPNSVFIRIQRSTYINKSRVIRVSFSEDKIYTASKEFDVSKAFKKNIYEFHHLSN